ncbi:MAG TPA: cytochrome c-type biogenesis protein [Gammaproteobacteria bacterium]|nr:cytochrome c-type biogenesis protein [Gammaproteobacteria bacterium]
MTRKFTKWPVLMVLLLLGSAGAQDHAVLEFSHPEYKERYNNLINQLRCLVCQNQTIADSHAELALDLRKRVYEMIEQGASDRDVIDFMAQRYGDFVLYNPPLKPSTMLLWFAPFIAIGVGSVALLLYIVRRNRQTAPAAEVSESIRRRVEELRGRQQARPSKQGSKQ